MRFRRSLVIELLSVFLVSFFIYTITLSRSIGTSHDSIEYLNSIDKITRIILPDALKNRVTFEEPFHDISSEFFHPHHLLYNTTAAVWLTGWRVGGSTLNSEVIISLLNSLFGALGLVLFYAILRREVNLPVDTAFLGTMIAGFSFTYWFHAICVEVYIIPICFLLLAFSKLIRPSLSNRDIVIIGIAHGIAVLFHQVHVLFFLPVFVVLLYHYRNNMRVFFKRLFLYGIIMAAIVGIPYLWVTLFFLKLSSVEEIVFWLTEYAHNAGFWNSLSGTTALKALMGFCRAIIGGHFVFILDSVQNFIRRAFTEQNITDDVFLIRKLSMNMFWCISLSAILAFAFIFWNLITSAKFFKTICQSYTVLLIGLFTWFIVYSIFFFFWVPFSPEFWLPQLLCFWIFFIILLKEKGQTAFKNYRVRPSQKLATLALLLFISNFYGSIAFIRSQENDYYYSYVKKFQTLPSQSLLIIGKSWIIENYIIRYADIDVFALEHAYIYKGNTAEQIVSSADSIIQNKFLKNRNIYLTLDAMNVNPILTVKDIRFKQLAPQWENYLKKYQIFKIDNDIYKIRL